MTFEEWWKGGDHPLGGQVWYHSDVSKAYRAGQEEMRERAAGTLRRDTLRQMGVTADGRNQ
jgi:hypothetical protein